MRNYLCIKNHAALLCLVALLPGCRKDNLCNPNDLFSKDYTSGIIKFSYAVPFRFNGVNFEKDTTVQFTSIGNNPLQKDDYGYSRAITRWVQLNRLNPDDFQNNIFIFFSGINLHSLVVPYSFKPANTQDAQINYVIGSQPFYDPLGNLVNGTNTYTASTYSDNFTLIVLSKVNNRLQGTFSGTLKNQNGFSLNIKDGLFDIVIVEK